MKYKLAALAGFLLGAFLSTAAFAHDPQVTPGAACSTVGATGQHDGQTYRCERHKGETCPHFHWIYNPGVPKSGRTAWPVPSCPCASSTPTPTGSPTTPASPTAPASPSTAPASTQASPTTALSAPTVQVVTTGSLPVTGSPIVGLLVLGGLSLAVGLLILAAARAWRRRTT